jgi:transposase
MEHIAYKLKPTETQKHHLSQIGGAYRWILSDRIYTCDCGNTKSRDWNAAINIRNKTLNELNRNGICRIKGQGDTSGGIFVAGVVHTHSNAEMHNI